MTISLQDKYQPTTAQHVRQVRESNLCATLQQIADKCKVSRERVRQILKKENLPTRHYSSFLPLSCLNCQLPMPKEHKKWCSRKCQWEYTHPLVECDYCHKLFRRGACELARASQPRHVFCTSSCMGKWFRTHHGSTGRPRGSRTRVPSISKYTPLLPGITDMLQQGYSLYGVCKLLRIPIGSQIMVRNLLARYRPDVLGLGRARNDR